MIVMVEESKNVGAATQQTLVAQGEQLASTKRDTFEVSTYVGFAKKMITALYRKIITDKIAMFLIVLAGIGIVVMILLKVFNV
jgi:hypothetical protein